MEIKPLRMVGSDLEVEFTCEDGTKKTQIISGVPVTDKDAAKAFLTDYGVALARGIEQEKADSAVPTPASGLIGVKFVADVEPETP